MTLIKKYNRPLLAWIIPLLIIGLWQILGQNGYISNGLLPTPWGVVQAFKKLLLNGTLLKNIEISTKRALTGFLIGGGAGLILGLLNGISRITESLTDSTIQAVRNIPHLALIPLVILWFGIGEESKVFLIALGVAFPIYINTFHGVRNVDRGLIEMGKVYRLGKASMFWNILLPGALPSILIGVRYALGVMWLTLIVAETISADSGLGYMAMNAREFLQMDVIVLAILIYAILGKLADLIAKWVEYLCLKWHPNFQKK